MKNIHFLRSGTKISRPVLIAPFVHQANLSFDVLTEIKNTPGIDAIEWRLDSLTSDTLSSITKITEIATRLKNTGKKILGTLRTTAEGGGDFNPDISDYAACVRQLATLVDAVDVEIFRDGATDLIQNLLAENKYVVGSFHNWHETPDKNSLVDLFIRIAETGAKAAKIAVTPKSTEDVNTLLAATQTADSQLDIPVIGISMGELGVISRTEGYLYGSAATFVSCGQTTAPGQLSAQTLLKVLS